MPNSNSFLFSPVNILWLSIAATSLTSIQSKRLFLPQLWKWQGTVQFGCLTVLIGFMALAFVRPELRLFWMNQGNFARLFTALLILVELVRVIGTKQNSIRVQKFSDMSEIVIAALLQYVLYLGSFEYRVMKTRRLQKIRFYCTENCDAAPSNFPVEKAIIGSILLVFVILEILHRFRNTQEVKLGVKAAIKESGKVDQDSKMKTRAITLKEFDQNIKNGEKWAILDGLVVDIAEFITSHPGGTHLIENQIGKDITKYFHGAQSASTCGNIQPHFHSPSAKLIVNQLTIGRFVGTSGDFGPISSLIRVADIDGCANASGSCKTIKFVEACEPVVQYKKYDMEDSQSFIHKKLNVCPLIDVSQMGKYYLIKSTSHPVNIKGSTKVGQFDDKRVGITRQYSDCFVMRKGVYQALLRIGSDPINSRNEKEALRALILKGDSDGFYLSIKNYHDQMGLSRFIHDDISQAIFSKQMQPLLFTTEEGTDKMQLPCKQVFNVQGPFGKGLRLSPSGKHIAFVAGTGILPFLDLVGHLILRITAPQLVLKSSLNLELESFSLALHCYFKSPEEAIGLDLLSALEHLCQDGRYRQLFSHSVHYTCNESEADADVKAKMDDYLRADDYKQVNKINKVFVCGPRGLEEMFERIVKDVRNSSIEFEIL